MAVFTLNMPLYIDNEGKLTVDIPFVNHNVLTPMIIHEIFNNICGDPLGVGTKHESKGGNDIFCLLMYLVTEILKYIK